MRFKRYGKSFQLVIEDADDLGGVMDLDESLWVATSAPLSAFRADADFLACLDTDQNGRIQVHELREAVAWTLNMLADRSVLGEDSDHLLLAALKTPEAESMRRAAAFIANAAGDPAPAAIDLAQVRAFLAELEKRPLNGDGVVTPESTVDPEVRQLIHDAVSCMGPVTDASGRKGVTGEAIVSFRNAAVEYVNWRDRATAAEGAFPDFLPFGEATADAYAALLQVRDQIDLFFAQCRAMRFDPKAGSAAGSAALDPATFAFSSQEGVSDYLRRIPIGQPSADGRLSTAAEQINPVYRERFAAFLAQTVRPVLNDVPEVISEDAWARIKAVMAPYEAYLAEKRGACVDGLPLERLRQYLAGNCIEKAEDLVAADRDVAAIRQGAVQLKKLLLYRRYLVRLLNNFVTFQQLYAVEERAMFEAGSLVIDGRWLNFAIPVQDLKQHQAAASSSNLFILYVEVKGKHGRPDMTVAVPATAGSKGNLRPGKQGLFVDVDGVQYDARVVQIIENPISLREALGAPFVRLWHFIIGKIEAMSASSEKDLQKQADQLLKAPAAGGAPAAAGGMGTPGILMGLSVSVAAMGSAFAYITKTLAGMTRSQALVSLLGAVFVVGFPVSLVAILKLRSQDLSALLEGCGWAINARMRLTRAQRRQFTQRRLYPAGAEGVPASAQLWWLAILLWALLIWVYRWIVCGP